MKIYFYKKKINDEIIDADDKTAHIFHQNRNEYIYLGWADDTEFKQLNHKYQVLAKPKKQGDREVMTLTKTQHKNRAKELIAKREEMIKWAIENSDKLPPTDRSRTNLEGRPLNQDPSLRGASGAISAMGDKL